MILHADANSFYASCEQIYRPDLRDKPVVVLSNNDGILIAVNKEAKNLGLKRGDPYFKVKDFCDNYNVAVFSSNYTLYADISRRIKLIYMEYTPDSNIEEYSIDESFLFFDNCKWSIEDFYKIGAELKKRVAVEIGVPISIGGAPSKTLAKLFNKKAKTVGIDKILGKTENPFCKYVPDGCEGIFIYDACFIDELLQSVDCGSIWGIGGARAEKLKAIGVENALQLKNLPLNKAKELLTVQGVATVQELNGISCIDKVERHSHECLTSSRQFSKKVYDLKTMETAVVKYCQLVVEKLRIQNSEAGGVGVMISTCNYYNMNQASQYSNFYYTDLLRQTSYTPDIVKAAIECLHHIYREGYGYKTLMINLYKLMPACLQGELWIDPQKDINNVSFMKTVDELTGKYGRDIVSLAKGVNDGDWQMSRKRLSPCWTTQIDDIPRIK